jgi:hypothetical protein
MPNFFQHKLIIAVITILVLTSFFTIYDFSQAGSLFQVSDVMSRMKIGVPSNHTISFRLTLATNVTQSETITIAFSSGFAADLNGIDCGDIDLLDDGVQENLSAAAAGCKANATEWGAFVSDGTLTLTAPSADGTYIDGSSDVIVKIGNHTTEGGTGNKQIINPSTPGNYLIIIGGTFGGAKTIAIAIADSEQVSVLAEVPDLGQPPPPITPDTTSPVIFNLQVINITQTSATITWQTDEASTTLVDYGLTTSYEFGTAAGISFVTVHSVDLAGLSPDTLYHFRVRSADFFGNEAVTVDQTFRTLALPDLIPPIISNIQVINIAQTSATVTWDTNEPAASRLEYGLTTAYGLGTITLTDLVLSHSIPLSGLTPNTLYHFRVSSTDAVGNPATSNDQTFRTLPDLTPPANVSNFQATAGDGQVSLSWVNPPDPDFAGVKILRKTGDFPRGSTDGTLVYDGIGASRVDTGLTNDITYYYGAFSYDAAGNFASGALASATPRALLQPPPDPPLPPDLPAPPVAPPVGAPVPGAPAVPAAPPVPVPPVTVLPEEKTDFPKIDFYTKDRSLKLSPDYLEKTARTLVSWPLVVSLPVQNLPKASQQIILTISQSSYRLEINALGAAYEADLIAPGEPGQYGSLILIFYADGTTDVIDFTLLVDPYGIVYEILENKILPVKEATATLYQLIGNEWRIWPANRFGQDNPKLTTAAGNYGFLVPPGIYYLKTEKEGYWSRETLRFEVKENVVNLNIELWPIPVLKPTLESLGEIISFGARVGGEAVTKVIDNPQVEKINERAATPAVAALALISYSTAISLTSLLPYLQFIFTQPILLLFPKRRKGWGIVYNALSKMPLDLAIVRLYEKVTGRLVQTRVTDREGRFAFFIQPGAYHIKVAKPNFSFPTFYLKDKREDIKYLDIYHGEEILATEKNTLMTPNIPLDPVEIEKAMPDRRVLLAYFGRKFQDIAAAAGIVLTAVSVLISPKLWVIGILTAHCALYALFKRLARPRRPKSWGIVYEGKTKAPVGMTVARIFETEYNKLLETQVTDNRGRYSFLVGNNVYYVTFSKPEFKPKRTEAIDLREAGGGAVVGLDVTLERE